MLDCSDLERAAEFWAGVLGYVRNDRGDHGYLSLQPSDGVGVELLLQQVPEEKHAKNRLHLDLRTRQLDDEVARVRALGARLVTTAPVVEGGWTWHILTDPDDNEFCVISPSPDYWEGESRV